MKKEIRELGEVIRVDAPRHSTRLPAADQDLTVALQTRDKALEALIQDAQRYRAILRSTLRALWTGADPAPHRAALEPWRPILQRIKRAARALTL